MLATSQSIPVKTYDGSGNSPSSQHSHQQSSRESLLSKSLGHHEASASSLMSFHRRSSEMSEITHCGYLLKRSNHPFREIPTFPLDPNNDSDEHDGPPYSPFDVTPAASASVSQHSTESLLPPSNTVPGDEEITTTDTSLTVAEIVQPPNVIGNSRCDMTGANTNTTKPQHLEESDIKNVASENSSFSAAASLAKSVDFLSSFFGMGDDVEEQEEHISQTLTPTNMEVQATTTIPNGHDTITTTTTPAFVSPDPPHPSTATIPIQQATTATQSVPISFQPHNTATAAAAIPVIVHRNDSAPITYSTHHTSTTTSSNGVGGGRISQPPPDFVDPQDGHIWRAKYCVLEDGILYFYRNATDGESNEAKAERSNYCRSGSTGGTLGGATGAAAAKSMAEDVMDLSKSPMTRPRILITTTTSNTENATNPSPLHHENSFHDLKYHHAMWEKRVALDCVGAVRSAELEYGTCSFELLAVEDSDASSSSGSTDDDTIDEESQDDQEEVDHKHNNNNFQGRLILRAGNTEEMKDWLLQFHRSLASVITHIVEAAVESKSPAIGFPLMAFTGAGGAGVGTTMDPTSSGGGGLLGHAGDMHHPPQSFITAGASGGGIPPPPLSQSVGGGGFLSNHLTNHSNNISGGGSITHQQKKKHHHHHPAALSHGHGRSGMHRRRPHHYGQGGGATVSTSGGDALSSGSPTSSTLGGSGNLKTSPKHTQQLPTLLLEPRKVTQPSGGGLLNEMDGGFLISPSSSTDVGIMHGDTINVSSELKTDESSPLPSNPVHAVAPSPLPSLKQQDDMESKLSAPVAPLPPKSIGGGGGKKYIPPHLRQKKASKDNGESSGGSRYVPPHLRGESGLQPATDSSSALISTDNATKLDVTSGESTLSMEKTNKKSPLSNGNYGALAISDSPQSLSLPEGGEGDILPCPDFFKMGGCADPTLSVGSILDSNYIGRKASRIGSVRTDSFGCVGGGNINNDGDSSKHDHDDIVLVTDDEGGDALNGNAGGDVEGISNLRWEVGAVSECGIRNSNEDSYLIASNLIKTFESLPALRDVPENSMKPLWTDNMKHQPGLFAIFDGHCGNQAARYAAEKLLHFILDESLNNDEDLEDPSGKTPLTLPEDIQGILYRAIAKLDDRFCGLCTEDGREWESGSTAIVAMVAQEHVILANLGDCRGVISCSTGSSLDDTVNHRVLQRDGWTELEIDDLDDDETRSETQWNGTSYFDDKDPSARCWWKEVAEIHSPSREDERVRIEKANGWVTTETEMPIGQLKRMDLYDEDVVEILKRCFSDRYQSSQQSSTPSKRCNAAPHRILHISRVCGELAVSRALGDRDFKAAFNKDDTEDNDHEENLKDRNATDKSTDNDPSWENLDLFLPWPDNHTQRFSGDLVSAVPEIKTFKVGQKGAVDEFLLLACDGLWDVMDPDDAVRVTRGLLFQKKWAAKKAAARLAEIAIHLGSSDNITVILISFSTKD